MATGSDLETKNGKKAKTFVNYVKKRVKSKEDEEEDE